MALGHVIKEVSGLSPFAKIGVVLGLMVIVLLIAGTTRSCVSSYKDKQADKKQAELKTEADAARARADAAEAKARDLELKAKDQQLIIQAAGQKAEVAAQKVQDESKKFEDEMAAIGAPADPCERVRRICVRLNIKPADCPCTASQ